MMPTPSGQFFPAEPAEVWSALVQVVPRPGLKVRNTDEMLRRIELSAGVSTFSWGQQLAVSVQPGPDGGCYLTVTGAGNVPTIGNSSRIQRVTDDLIYWTSIVLRGGSPETDRPSWQRERVPNPRKPTVWEILRDRRAQRRQSADAEGPDED